MGTHFSERTRHAYLKVGIELAASLQQLPVRVAFAVRSGSDTSTSEVPGEFFAGAQR